MLPSIWRTTSVPDDALKIFDLECPNRHVLDLIADKWSVLILAVLFDDPTRFNALKRRLGGITQKALTDALRRLERHGVVSRLVLTGSPVAVEYSVTPLGRTLGEPFAALYRWTIEHHEDVERARILFDERGRGA
jgi:DNA-binding HxlR family transcriptional regulator